MPVYQSRIGKPEPHFEPEPKEWCIYVRLNELPVKKSEALWEALKRNRLEFAKLMTRDPVVQEIINQFGATFMMKEDEVNQLIESEIENENI